MILQFNKNVNREKKSGELKSSPHETTYLSFYCPVGTGHLTGAPG